ncbi:MAG: alcohol dehydrogenase catalytic domain-containing protein [Alicyclobacillus sp.]|nr:alcohol dehydrogenase catalytic domain-containing protein [Alicyclobacillus sp.]
MRAAVFDPTNGLHVLEVPRPVPGPGEVLLRVEACGVCGSDRQLLAGHEVPPGTTFPLIPGHEIAGRIESLGPGVQETGVLAGEAWVGCADGLKGKPDGTADGLRMGTGMDAVHAVEPWQVGDKVVVHPFIPCGRCRSCRSGRASVCPQLQLIGFHRPGGLAEWVCVPASCLVRRPAGLPAAAAAVLADAWATPLHALAQRVRVVQEDCVVVLGAGGLGVAAVQVCRLLGVRQVGVVTRRAGNEPELARAGAVAVWLRSGDGRAAARQVRRWADGGADVVVETTGQPEAFAYALDLVRPGGVVCLLGLPDGQVLLPQAKVVRRGVTALGSFGSTIVDLQWLCTRAAAGALNASELVRQQVPLAEVETAFTPAAASAGRTVVVPEEWLLRSL